MTPPATRREEVVDVLHDVEVRDPYRWLEDGASPEVAAWVDAQNLVSRDVLDVPDRRRWHDHLTQLLALPVATGGAGARRSPLRPRASGRGRAVRPVSAFLHRRGDGADHPARPSQRCRRRRRRHRLVRGRRRRLAGRRRHQRRGHGGIRAARARRHHRRRPRRGHPRHAGLQRRLGPGRLAASRTRAYPAGDQYHRTVHHHTLGADWRDDPVVWAEHPDPQAWPDVELSPDGRWLLVHVLVGWARYDVHLLDRRPGRGRRSSPATRSRRPSTSPPTPDHSSGSRRSTPRADGWSGCPWAARARRPGRRSSRKVGPCSGSSPSLATRCGSSPRSGPSIASSGSRPTAPRSDRSAGVGDVIAVAGLAADRATGRGFAVVDSFGAPTTVWSVTGGSAQRWFPAEPADAAARPVHDRQPTRYPSLDGTTIGLFLVHRQDVEPGPSVPAILNGYGGFAITETPVWSPQIAAWCAAGGVYAIAGLRGGLEHGEAWHLAGRRANKQNVFDDFHAAADWLVETGRASPRPPGDPRAVQRRAPRRRRPDPTPRPVPGRVVRGAAARHGPLPAVPHRSPVDRRVRRPRRGRGVRLAARLLAVPPRRRRDLLPGDAVHDGRGRHAGRPAARPQDGGAAAGVDELPGRPADPAAAGGPRRARRRQARRQAGRRAGRRPDVPRRQLGLPPA